MNKVKIDIIDKDTRKTTRIIIDPENGFAVGWRVIFNGRLTSPIFSDKGAAVIYANMLLSGKRKPEYSA